ncbi:MAG TPA: SMP-30/gluconolactonase/LRE family protein [Ktedonobacteraceae bacterium]|nr:SMP-30/gluconolactonase/LRE family protein [Ktedonobacteraceae bacterium]
MNMSVSSATPGRPGLKRSALLTFLGMCVFLIMALLFANATVSATSSVQTIKLFNFSAGQTPENIAINDEGTIYVSLAYASTVWKRTTGGAEETVVLPTAGGIIVGLALDDNGNLDVAVRSSDAQAAGIWQLPYGHFQQPQRLVSLPTNAFPNGMAFDDDGNLYVADSSLGCIWRVRPASTTADVWLANPLLAPNGTAFQGFEFPGANGLKLWHHSLYVSNTSTQTIIRIPLTDNGQPGVPAVLFQQIQADDFAFDVRGNLYVAENARNDLLRVTPDGQETVLATKAADGLDNPSAVAFGTSDGDRTDLYITNAAYFSTNPRPSVLRLSVGIPGLPID